MGTFALSRFALTITAAAALLAACSGSQSSIGAPGAMPQSIGAGSLRLQPALAQRVPRGTGEVQYIANYYETTLLEFDYPKGESSIGSISDSGGLCTKGARTFWVAMGYEIAEFKAGGTSPIRVLKPGGGACAIDPASGNLASLTSSGVIIFRHARGKGKVYGGTGLVEAFFDGYDSGGNLFLDGFNSSNAVEVVELPKGSSTFEQISFKNGSPSGSIQWDGTYLTIGCAQGICRYRIIGTKGVLKGIVPISGCVQTWIERPYVYCADAGNNDGEVYNYPAGGSPIATLTGPFDFPIGVVSLRVR